MENIITTATAAGNFTKLVAAINAAGLGEALNATGPFTVFAPNDEAFAKLPNGTLDGLLKDIPKLTSILKYHVVSGKVMGKDVQTMDGKTATTLNGADLNIATGGGVRLNKSHRVIKTDIECSNGVIHVIDQLLMPPLAAAAAVAHEAPLAAVAVAVVAPVVTDAAAIVTPIVVDAAAAVVAAATNAAAPVVAAA
jgi:uncharacterized surface protein with fasciclin (FAS1) repeats